AQCPARDAFFRKGIAVIVGHVAGIQMQLGVNGGVAVIHGVRILGVQRHCIAVNVLDGLGNQEWGNGFNVSSCIDDRLVKTRSFASGLREQAPGSGIGAEVEVEGTVFLEENEDILNVLTE